MSERYGAPDELAELCASLEDWLNEAIDVSVAELKRLDGLGDPRYEAGRLQTLRDVLEILVVNP